MRRCVIAVTIIILSVILPAQLQAQLFGTGAQVKSVPAGGTPVVADNLVNGPVPRLPDGKPGGIVHRYVLNCRERLRARQPDVAHVADVENSDPGPHSHVLGNDSAAD